MKRSAITSIFTTPLARPIGHCMGMLAAACLAALSTAQAAPFTAGNVVIYRIGTGVATGAGSLVGTGAPVFLDEYTAAGVLVQSVALPTTASGAQKQLVASGTAGSEGMMSRSVDGRFMMLTGYASNIPGAAALSGTAATTVSRVVGRVDAAGNVDTSTALNDYSTANNPRSVTSTNGTDIWVNGAAGGVRYTTFGATTSTQLSTTLANLRQASIFNGQLYVGTSNGSAVRIGTVGSGLPTTSGQTITNLPGFPTATGSPYSFFLADLDATAPGLDTLYVADDTNSAGVGGIQKYALVAGAWVSKGTVGTPVDAYRGLTGRVSSGSVTLFATRKGGSTAAGGGEIVSFVDSTGYNAAMSGSPTLVATAAANVAFRGIDLAPAVAPDLAVSVSGPATAAVGANVSYVANVVNTGGANASGVVLRFTLPSGVTFASASGTGFTASETGGVVTFTGGAVAAGASAALTVVVTPTTPGTITLPGWAAVVDPQNNIAELNEGNNNSPLPVTTFASLTPDLTVSYTGPAQAVKDASFAYTLTASNGGLADATGVKVHFTLPSGVTFSSGSGAGYTVAETGGVVTFSGGSIVSGCSSTLTVNVTASPSTPTSYTAAAGAAVIDPANAITEASETNNSSTSAVTTFVRLFPLPTAAADTFSITGNTSLSVNAAGGLLANDSSATLGFIRNASPAHGTLTLNPDGSFTYTPDAGFSGTDSFTYKVSDCVKTYQVVMPTLGMFGGVTVDGTGFGSSIYAVPSTTDEFYGITDRGPNVDGPSDSKVFPITSFTPSIARFKLINGRAVLQGSVIPMKAPNGTPYSGLGNSANDDGSVFYDLAGNVLASDVNGFDTEGLVAMADGTLWISDEYGPFINHLDATGTEVLRLSPMAGTLPVELAHRISNKGMEGLTVTPDGTTLVGIMQGALNQPDLASADATKIAPIRILTYTIASGVTHEYLYMLANPNTNNKVGVSEITALSNTTFLVDERDNGFPPSASKKLYRIDITGATDVGPLSTVAGAVYEATGDKRGLTIGGSSIELLVGTTGTADATATLATAGITPVSKVLHFDLGALLSSLDSQGRFFSHDKIEGISIANGGNTIIVVNDNDFGIGGLANAAAPFELSAKSSTATPGVTERSEFLVVDLTRLPAATDTATVTLNVTPASDPLVSLGAIAIADGQPGAVDFGSVSVLSNASQTFTITNAGSADLTGNTITIDGANAAEFSVTAAPATTVVAAGTTTLTVAFAPSASGLRSAALHIVSNAPGAKASYDFPLSGTGIVMPNLTVTMVHNGTFHQRDNGSTFTITVTNSGTATTDGSAVSISATLPAGFVPAASNNGTINGWTVSVSGQNVSATRSGALAAGSSFPALTIAVNVDGNAGASLASTVVVSGGGDTTPGDNSGGETTSVSAPLPVTFLGVMAGDADSTSVTLWTRINQTVSVTLSAQVATDPAFTAPVSFAVSPDAAKDYTAKVSATGLASGTKYFYRFVVGGTNEVSDVGTFKTAPAANVAAALKFAFSGDNDGLMRPYALASTVAAENLDFYVNLGDVIYENASNVAGNNGASWLNSPSVTLSGSPINLNGIPTAGTTWATQAQLRNDYRKKYRENFLAVNNGGQNSLKSFYAGQASYTTWDNHELGNRQYINGGAPAGGSVGGPTGTDMATGRGVDARNSAFDVNTSATDYMNRSTGFLTLEEVFVDYQPIADRGFVNAPADPRTHGTRQLYFAQPWGKNALYVNLDSRSYRDIRSRTTPASGNTADDTSAPRANNPGRSMLGVTQFDWLKQSLLTAQANGTLWKFVTISDAIDQLGPIGGSLSTVTAAAMQPFSGNAAYGPVNADGGKTYQGAYRAERNALLKFIADNHITNVVFLSTDDHQNRINELTYSPTGQTEVQASYVKVPYCFSIVCGPLGATGPDLFLNHDFTRVKGAADLIANAQVAAGIEPIGLVGYPGLHDVVRDGNPNAGANPQPVDFYSPDTFNYTTLSVSANGRTLTVASQGMSATAQNSASEYNAGTNPEHQVFSFQVDAISDPNVLVGATPIVDGQATTVDFGSVNVASSSTKTFTIQNNGTVNLTGIAISIDGANAGDFSVTTAPAVSVAPLASTTFIVSFSPAAIGARSAALHIASNASGAESSYDFPLSGSGNSAPMLTLPASPVIAEATSAAGAVVTFLVSATDTEDGPFTPSVTPASGSNFIIGDTLVSVSATDIGAQTTTETFTVRVRDTIAPVVALHGDVTAEATGAAGAIVTFAAGSASDAVGVASITYSQASGSVFPLGDTVVTIAAEDAAHNVGTSTFTVRVQDTTAPTLNLPASPVLATATGASGAVVTFHVSATDLVDPSPVVVATPASGSIFPVGDTTVGVTATDSAGRVANGSFIVRVAKANQAITFAPPATAYSTDSITLSATGGASGNAVTFSVVSGPGALAGNVLTFTAGGSVVLRANQAGDTAYNAAPNVNATIAVTAHTAPVAVDDAVTTTVGKTLLYPLANDHDADGSELSISAVSHPAVVIAGRALVIPAGFTGTFRYTVSDGIASDTGDVTVNAGALTTARSQWSGLLYDSTGTIAGRMQAIRSSTGRFTYAVRVGANQISGIFALNAMHTATVGALSITEDADNRLTIAYTGGGNLTGNLRQSPTSATPRQLNVALAGAAPISLRGGGYLRAYVRATSKVNVLGVLPDGRTFVAVSALADNGSISFYIPVAKSLATTIGGELTLGDLTATDCTGELEWNRNGALTTLTANGSLYSASTALPSGACTLTLTGADLASTIHVATTATSGRPTLSTLIPAWTVKPSLGTFLVKVKTPVSARPAKGSGIYLQKSNSAWGYFPGTTQGDLIQLQQP